MKMHRRRRGEEFIENSMAILYIEYRILEYEILYSIKVINQILNHYKIIFIEKVLISHADTIYQEIAKYLRGTSYLTQDENYANVIAWNHSKTIIEVLD